MFIEAGHTQIHADIRGTGEPIVILHGLSLDARSMEAWLEPVFDGGSHSYKRIYLDMPGMGRSPVGRYIDSSDKMLDAVAEAIERIAQTEPVLLCGFSYGSYIVQGLVHRLGAQRIRGVALIGPLVYPYNRKVPPQAVLERDEALFERLTAEEKAVFEGATVLQTPIVWERFATELIPGSELSDRAFLTSEFRTKRYALGFDVVKLPEPFPAPTLIVCGRQDHIAGFENAFDLLESYPRASLHILDRAGHYLMLEQRETVQKLTAEWLSRIETDAASF